MASDNREQTSDGLRVFSRPLLYNIDLPDDIKYLSIPELTELCAEARRFLIYSLSRTGGHVASNLGVVELITALHACFDTSTDRLVFDVGHQCYTHKLYTGRLGRFSTLRRKGGLSGFPKPAESEHDAFIAGHASNAVSVALGLARAEHMKPEAERAHVVALVGDGALGGGLSYEALDDAGGSGLPLIVILNDNGMSISRSVGALSVMLNRFRLKKHYQNAKRVYHRVVSALPGGNGVNRFFSAVKDNIKHAIIPNTFFEGLGFEYFGPVDGHDLTQLCDVFSRVRSFDRPVLVHVITQKGKGYSFSEGSPESFHGVDGFDIETGDRVCCAGTSFSSAFGAELCRLAQGNPKIVAITAAMRDGAGLAEFSERFPERFFDVGIAEEHAVTMAAGMAKGGAKPFAAMYSTFLQRSYDELMHDVGILSLPVVLCVDRAGLVGEDGETHQGIYDLGMLSQVPGMRVYMPSNAAELAHVLRFAAADRRGPIAIRYPRGCTAEFTPDTFDRAVCVAADGCDITLCVSGRLIDGALAARGLLAERGISARVIKLNRVCPLPLAALPELAAGPLLVCEEHADTGSAGRAIAAELRGIPVFRQNCGDRYIAQATVAEQLRECGLDAAGIAARAAGLLGR